MTDARFDDLAEQLAPEDLADLGDGNAHRPSDEEPDRTADYHDLDSPAHRGGRTRRGLSKPAALKAIGKYVELTGAPAQHLELLSTAIGVKSDPAELAAAIICAPRVSLGALNDLTPVIDAAEDSAYAAMFAVFKLDRDQLKQIWAILTAVGITSGALPSKDSTAAVAVAEAAAKVGKSERALFESVRDLARK